MDAGLLVSAVAGGFLLGIAFTVVANTMCAGPKRRVTRVKR